MSEEATPLAPNQFRIRGRLVTLRTSFPMPANNDLIGLMNQTDVKNLSTMPPLLARVVESMEGVEEPTKPESYAEMDALLLWPLFRRVDGYLYDCMYTAPKN